MAAAAEARSDIASSSPVAADESPQSDRKKKYHWTDEAVDALLVATQAINPYAAPHGHGQVKWADVALSVNTKGFGGATARNCQDKVIRMLDDFEVRDAQDAKKTGSEKHVTPRDSMLRDLIEMRIAVEQAKVDDKKVKHDKEQKDKLDGQTFRDVASSGMKNAKRTTPISDTDSSAEGVTKKTRTRDMHDRILRALDEQQDDTQFKQKKLDLLTKHVAAEEKRTENENLRLQLEKERQAGDLVLRDKQMQLLQAQTDMMMKLLSERK